jgi:hypothetical protein
MISVQGIEIHPSSSKTIPDIKPPRNLKELQSLTGKLTILSRFIAKSGEVCLSFFKAVHKKVRFEWTIECAEAFEKIK